MTPQQLQSYSASHLRYEGHLFFLVGRGILDRATKIHSGDPTALNESDADAWAELNGMLEAFALKTRLFRDFFFDAANPKPDDVFAYDFAPQWSQVRGPKPPAMAAAATAANKAAAHMTAHAIARDWPVDRIVEETADLFEHFFAQAANIDAEAEKQIREGIHLARLAIQTFRTTAGTPPSTVTSLFGGTAGAMTTFTFQP